MSENKQNWCPKCKENGAPTMRINDQGEYCIECVECYEVSTPWFPILQVAEGYWLALKNMDLNDPKITMQKLSLEDWLLISACVKNDAQQTLEEFLKREDGLLGAAGTVGNKLRDLSEKISQHAEFLAKIDPLIMDKIIHEKESSK